MSYKRMDKSLEDIDIRSTNNHEYKNKDKAFTRERKRLIGERTNTTYKIGDKVKIRVKSASKLLRQIDFELA